MHKNAQKFCTILFDRMQLWKIRASKNGRRTETIVELGGHNEDQLRAIEKRIIHKINTAKQVGILAKSWHISFN